VTKAHNTISVDPNVLATSNGHSGMDGKKLGSTSFGSVNEGGGGRGSWARVGVVMGALVGGAGVVVREFW